MCEFCSPGDDECGVCRDWDRRRSYSRAVSSICLASLFVIMVVAVICALVNTFGGKH
jgi:hypothetical protein